MARYRRFSKSSEPQHVLVLNSPNSYAPAPLCTTTLPTEAIRRRAEASRTEATTNLWGDERCVFCVSLRLVCSSACVHCSLGHEIGPPGVFENTGAIVWTTRQSPPPSKTDRNVFLWCFRLLSPLCFLFVRPARVVIFLTHNG